MSSSTRRRTLVDVMLESIRELTYARPHVHETAHFSAAEWRAYRAGYYMGLLKALEAAALGAERFRLRVKTLRAVARTKRSA